MYDPQLYFPMAASDTFDLPNFSGTEPTPSRRITLTKKQKTVLLGTGGAAILSGSALAWGMTQGGLPNPFAAEVPSGSDLPDEELSEEETPAVDAPSAETPADSTSVAQAQPAGTLQPLDGTPAPQPEATGMPALAPVGAAGASPSGMSFGEAFAAAREEVGPGGYFVWNGGVYNTFFKEEWEALSPGEQQEYVAAVQEDRLETWQQQQHDVENVTIDDTGTGVVFGDPNAQEGVPEAETPQEPAGMQWLAGEVDGHHVALGNADDDDTAEVMVVDGRIAVVDADNDGTFDHGARINAETGSVGEWVELPQPIDAPSMGESRGTEEAAPTDSRYASQEGEDFGDDFNNQAGTADFV